MPLPAHDIAAQEHGDETGGGSMKKMFHCTGLAARMAACFWL